MQCFENVCDNSNPRCKNCTHILYLKLELNHKNIYVYLKKSIVRSIVTESCHYFHVIYYGISMIIK